MEHIDKLSYNMPVWSRIDDVPMQFPWLDEDQQAEICVIGGGLTGSMCAMELSHSGHDVLLITDGMAGMGETARMMPCSCADLGMSIRHMRRIFGETLADYLIKGAQGQLDRLEELYKEYMDGRSAPDNDGNELYDFGFSRRDCFIFSDDDSDGERIKHEFNNRRDLGMDCAFISGASARDMFSFEVYAGIMLRGQACVLDPYRLAHYCLKRAMENDARVYENTKALRIDAMDSVYGGDSGEGWVIITDTHRIIECEKVIVAAGDACRELLDGVGTPRTSYMTVSRQMRNNAGWPGKCVLRTFSAPELTIAMSPDRRVFAGGLSSSVMDENARFAGIFHMPAVHEKRFSELEAGARYLCPPLAASRRSGFEFAQASRECRTADGLPIIGECDGREDCIFAVPGGGGALMSMLCAHNVTEMVNGETAVPMLSPHRRSLRARSA